MGMWASVDIFQAKVYDLLGDIDEVKTESMILVLIKEIFSKYIEQLSIIFDKLCAADLNQMLISAVLGERGFLT